VFKTLICTVLCSAACSAFAARLSPASTPTATATPHATPFPGTTTLAFYSDACGGASTTTATLNGVGGGTRDVLYQTTTASAAGAHAISAGEVMLFIATDGSGNPASVASNKCWVRIDGSGHGRVPDAKGNCCFPVDLGGLANLGLTDCKGNPLRNVTCDTRAVGFRAQYHPKGPPYLVKTHFSVGSDLLIACAACGTKGAVTVGSKLVRGNGNPLRSECDTWVYRITVQNCTGYDLTNVKVQGGTSDWTTLKNVAANIDGTSPVKLSTKETTGAGGATTAITWAGNLNKGDTLDIDITVYGCIAASQVCNGCDTLNTPVAGSVLYLSGPWSAVYTDPHYPLGTKSTDSPRVTVEAVCLDPTLCLPQ
jgi:hypothetical protein